jgi:Rrf2 family iron-sulfur cluster assembly transcriptional regulator
MNTRITKKTQYAVAAMLELARLGDSASISTISSSQGIEPNYMGIILLELKKKNLVSSRRGVKGGYQLSRAIESISVSEIMDAVGERVSMTRCKDSEDSCTGSQERCAAHKMWHGLEVKIESYLSSITLKDMLCSTKPLECIVRQI